MTDKALSAIIRQERAMQEVAILKRDIGQALAACPIIEKERMTVWPRIGMTESQHQAYMKNGGAKWLRQMIEGNV